MKKILALLLVAVLCVAMFSCNGNTDNTEASSDASVSAESTEPDNSVPEDESVEDNESVEDEPSNDESEEEGNEESEESDEPEESEEPGESEEIPAFISNFVSWAPLAVKLRADDSTSIRLTAVNTDAGYGDVVIYTYDYGKAKVTVENDNYADYAYLIAEYDKSVFGVAKKSVYEVGSVTDNSTLTIPEDGFIIAAHKDQATMVARLKECAENVSLFAAGVQVCDVNYSITETSGPITIDGVIDNEWSAHKIDTINENNPNWSYLKFQNEDYYTTAEYYVAYDADYLYLAVVVNSPYHFCPITPANANDMWKYECIQVKLSTQGPKSEYIKENYDHVINPAAHNEGIVRSYGFAVNDEGETCFYENSSVSKTFTGKAVCTRSDSEQLTTYEIAIPWAEYEIDVNELDKIGFTFSINSTNKEDFENDTWKNLVLRDGGGVINRNDWAKIPEVTIVH